MSLLRNVAHRVAGAVRQFEGARPQAHAAGYARGVGKAGKGDEADDKLVSKALDKLTALFSTDGTELITELGKTAFELISGLVIKRCTLSARASTCGSWSFFARVDAKNSYS